MKARNAMGHFMKTLVKVITLLLLTINLSYGQTTSDRKFLDKIVFGYTTRWDVEQLLGKGKYLTNKIINPDNEEDLNKPGYTSSNGLEYSKLGLLFVCADDSELITEVRFIKPYRGILEVSDTIEVGKTKLFKIVPQIKNFKVTTSIASNYWSFSYGNYMFYVRKSEEDRKDYFFSSYQKNSFKENLEYYGNRPVSIITYSIENKNNDLEEKELIKNNLHFIKPMYQPKNETHLNCYEYGWPDNLPSLFIPFYAMTGGSKSQKIKEGYWKEYSSRHKIIYEGTFKNNKKVGVFKYYDRNGNLLSTKTYSRSYWKWILLGSLLFALPVLVLILKKKKNVTRKPFL